MQYFAFSGKNNKIISNFGETGNAMGQKIKRGYLLPIMLLFAIMASAQDIRTINGKIVDASTHYPLPFASVSLTNSTFSNIANSEGEFSLKIPHQSLDDSLLISCLGYRNLKIAVADFAEKRKMRIKLEPAALDIRSITVRSDDATELFKSAFASRYIKKNYPSENIGMSGFYRETIKKGNKYISLSEAVVDILKKDYTSIDGDNTAIYKGRGSTNRNISDTLFMQLQGGPATSLNLDIVKNPFIGVNMISADYYYHFKPGPVMFMDDMNIYTIEFNQVEGISDILYRGRIFVESQSLAIVRIEFEMNVEGRKDAWKSFVRKKPSDIQIGVDWAKYQVNYRQHGEKWYLDYARIDLRFNAKYKGKWLKNKYDIITELAVTDIDNPSALKIPYAERFRMKDILQEKVADFQDDNFWENYNIIEPEEKIENIINKIIRQLKKERE